VPSSQNDGESRFAHLLQPIRDLATNWDIDLASDLEDYLSEVRHPFHVFFITIAGSLAIVISNLQLSK